MIFSRKQSITTYGIILTIIGIVLYLFLALLANNQLDRLTEGYHEKYIDLAKQELITTVNDLKADVSRVAVNLHGWEELLQQINDPTYYSYWLENRVRSVNFLPSYLKKISLYDKNAVSLEGAAIGSLSAIFLENLERNIIMIGEGYPIMRRCDPIREEYGKKRLVGYFCIDMDFIAGLKSLKTFNYIGDFSVENISIKSLDGGGSHLVGLEKILDDIDISLKKELSQSEFHDLTEETILRYLIVSAGFMFIFLYILLVLVGIPLRGLSSYINNLQIAGPKETLDIEKGYLEIEELETVYKSLGDYQRRLEESASELRRSEEHFRSLIENSTDVIMSLDKKGLIVYISPSVMGTLGYDQSEIFGTHIFEYIHADDIDIIRSSLGETQNIYDNLSSNEFRFKHKSGAWISLEASGEVLSEDNNYFTLNCRDITDRKRAQEAIMIARDQALEASNAKSNFLANTSHELRTPLNAILGYTEIVSEDIAVNDFSNIESDIEKVHTAAGSLLHLIDEVLDLSKIESGKMELSVEEILLRDLLTEIERTITPLMNKNSNTLEINIAGTVNKIKTDKNKLRQIIFNLLNNAAKFTHNGEVTLDVKLKKIKGRDWLEIVITDTGVGMNNEQQERVFEPFVQADTSTTRKYGGTGLGLTICRSFAHLMFGELTVQSEEGVGSAFTLLLPARIRESVERFQPRQAG